MNTKSKIIQSIKIWIVIYPSITLFYVLFGSYLTEMPLYIRTLILTLIEPLRKLLKIPHPLPIQAKLMLVTLQTAVP